LFHEHIFLEIQKLEEKEIKKILLKISFLLSLLVIIFHLVE